VRFTQEDARLLVSLQKQRRYDSELRRDHAQQPPEALAFRGYLLGSFLGSFQSFDLLSLDDPPWTSQITGNSHW
jgi:hypothetical protein